MSNQKGTKDPLINFEGSITLTIQPGVDSTGRSGFQADLLNQTFDAVRFADVHQCGIEFIDNGSYLRCDLEEHIRS